MRNSARTATWSGGWVNPYQTTDNALVAMFDGEWNAAGGSHADDPRWLYDIVSGQIITSSSVTYGPNHIKTALVDFVPSSVIDAINSNNHTVSICFDADIESAQVNPFFSHVNQFSCQMRLNQPLFYVNGSIVYGVVGYPQHKTYSVSVGDSGRILYNNASALRRISGIGTAYTGTQCRITATNTSDSQYCHIHSIRVYNRELSAEEISAICLNDGARFLAAI